MKKLSLLLFATLLITNSNAQSLSISRRGSDKTFDIPGVTEQDHVCYLKDKLVTISDEMFQQSNPNYIWIDFLIDGYVTYGDGRDHELFISENETVQPQGTVALPTEAAKTYIEKWHRFLEHIDEPRNENGKYRLKNYFGVDELQIACSSSQLRTKAKETRYRNRLVSRGELRLYKEMLKDGLATLDDNLDYDFYQSGFKVNDQPLTDDMTDKYNRICIEEFGIDFTTGENGHSRGSLKTFREEISILEQRFATANQHK